MRVKVLYVGTGVVCGYWCCMRVLVLYAGTGVVCG